mgnify:CR=1 FL=1
MKGLNKQEVEESKRKYGQNIIEEAEPETFFDKFKDALDDPMLNCNCSNNDNSYTYYWW